MKRLSIALMALGLSASSFAALPAATDPTLVAVPQLPGGFVIGATAYYLEPTFTNGDLDYASFNFGTTSTFFSSLQHVEPDYDWAWGANVGYIFPNTGNDVNLSYFHLDLDHNESVAGNPFLSIINFVDGEIDDAQILFAHSKADYRLNQLDLTAGQFIDVGCRLILHPFAGLRWASFDRDLDSAYFESLTTTPPFTLDDALFTKEESDFDGIGPLVGIDASYYIAYGLGAVAHFDSALLVGNIDVDTTAFHVENFGAGDQTFFINNFKAEDYRRIVPVMDAKLGLDYTYIFNNCANSDLTLEVGWMVSHYFNIADRVSAIVDDDSDVTIFAHKTSDFAFHGPYVSLILRV